jgi:hypothetical protein
VPWRTDCDTRKKSYLHMKDTFIKLLSWNAQHHMSILKLEWWSTLLKTVFEPTDSIGRYSEICRVGAITATQPSVIWPTPFKSTTCLSCISSTFQHIMLCSVHTLTFFWWPCEKITNVLYYTLQLKFSLVYTWYMHFLLCPCDQHTMEFLQPGAAYSLVNNTEAIFGISFVSLTLHPAWRSIVLSQPSL